jgi:4-amino-4-deoxy-L-arabinose transferase-like glycosyltransferase
MHRNNVIKISAFYGCLGFALVLAATSRYGIGLSADSVTYLAAARNLLAGRGYVNFDGEPVLAFPPLFSAVMAVISASFFDPVGVARFLNAFCFGLVVVLATHWIFRHLHSRFLAFLGGAAVLFSTALIGISTYAWSEPIFVLLTMLILLQFERSDFTDSPVPWALTGLFAALAILDRYAGIVLVITGIVLLAVKRTNSITSRLGRLVLFLSIAMLPISLWFYRNYKISSTITGYRVAADRTFLQSIHDTIKILSIWFLPRLIPLHYRVSLLLLLMIVVLWIVLRVLRIEITVADITEIIPFLLFTFLYTIFMIYTTSTTALSQIDDRYMSPIFIPLMLSLFYLLDRWMYKYSLNTENILPRTVLATCLVIWLIYPVAMTSKTVMADIEQGAGGFHTAYWMESDLISYLQSNKLSGSVYTNEPSAVYALTGQIYNPSPEKFAYESQEPTDDLVRFQADLKSHGVLYIVWFGTDWWKGYLYDIDELANGCALEKIATLKNGDIYRMSFSHCRGLT